MDATAQFPNIWRTLGLSVASGYAILGSGAMFAPVQAATAFGLMPKDDPEAHKFAPTVMAWIGGRDISIAAALFALYYQGKPVEMGTVILAGMILCTIDCITVYRHRRDALAVFLAAGAVCWGWIGWNLVKL